MSHSDSNYTSAIRVIEGMNGLDACFAAATQDRLLDSMGEVPVTMGGKLDRLELQHPLLTPLMLIGGGLAVGEATAEYRHGDSIREAESLSKQIIAAEHQNPPATTATVGLKEQVDHLNTGGAEISLGLIGGLFVYAGLRVALRTRFGWGSGARRVFMTGSQPTPSGRFTSLSTDSIHTKKKDLAKIKHDIEIREGVIEALRRHE